jgi:hypothetical protein
MTAVGVMAARVACCYCSVFIGNGAGCSANNGKLVTALGTYAECGNFFGGCTTSIGMYANKQASFSCESVVVGWCAGRNSASACQNVFLGACSGLCATTVCGAVYIGFVTGFCSNCTSITRNTFIGTRAGTCFQSAGLTRCICNVTALGAESRAYGTAYNSLAINQTMIGACSFAPSNNGVVIGGCLNLTTYLCGCLSKTSGSFQIKHPEPNSKKKYLYHSFVESPNRGDNLYRYKFNVCNCEHRIKLPNYYNYLNECNMAWVYAVNHFGEGYAKVDKEDLVIKTNKDGCYNVLLMGTRCDPIAVRDWEGVETIG